MRNTPIQKKFKTPRINHYHQHNLNDNYLLEQIVVDRNKGDLPPPFPYLLQESERKVLARAYAIPKPNKMINKNF